MKRRRVTNIFKGSNVVLVKVCILALDGLSFELVHRWNLKHLKQKQCGRFLSIINRRHGEPLSPQVWGSFVTGIVQDIDNWKVYPRFAEWIRWNTPIKRVRGSDTVRKTFGKKIFIPALRLLRLRKKPAGKEMLKGTTIFDLGKKRVAVNVPMYNLNLEWLFNYTEKIFDGDLQAFEDHVLNSSELMIQETSRRLTEDWNLLMTWIPLADQMGHVFMTRTSKMKSLYRRLNMLAYNIRFKLPKDCLLIIVSDHGMEVSPDGVSGRHTPYSFYSLSEKTMWKPEKITDFFSFINDQMNSVILS